MKSDILRNYLQIYIAKWNYFVDHDTLTIDPD